MPSSPSRALLVLFVAGLLSCALSSCLSKTAGGSVNNPDYRRATQPGPDVDRIQRGIVPTRITVEDADANALYGAARIALVQRFERLSHDDPTTRFVETPQFDILDTGSPTPPRSKVSVRVIPTAPTVLEVTALRIEATGLRGTILSGVEVPYDWRLLGNRPELESEIADLIIHTLRTADPATLNASASPGTGSKPAGSPAPAAGSRTLRGVAPGTPARATTPMRSAPSGVAPRIQPLRRSATTPARVAPVRAPTRPGQR